MYIQGGEKNARSLIPLLAQSANIDRVFKLLKLKLKRFYFLNTDNVPAPPRPLQFLHRVILTLPKQRMAS